VTARQTKGLLMWVMSHGVKGQGQTLGPAYYTYYRLLQLTNGVKLPAVVDSFLHGLQMA